MDVVLFCVKSYDTDSAVALLPPILEPDTAVVSLQNGIDNEARIAAASAGEHVLGGAAYIFAAVTAPGVVAASGPRSIVFGEWNGDDHDATGPEHPRGGPGRWGRRDRVTRRPGRQVGEIRAPGRAVGRVRRNPAPTRRHQAVTRAPRSCAT